MDKTGRLVWQQFTGEGLTEKTRDHPLVEIPLTRLSWQHVKQLYPTALVYNGKRKLFAYRFYRLFGWLMQKFDWIGYVPGKKDKRLPKKSLVAGLEYKGLYKAYPLTIFDQNQISLLEDTLEGDIVTLVHDGKGTVAFLESGLKIKDLTLIKDKNTYNLMGQAPSGKNYDDLIPLKVTNRAYWYLWVTFHPDTLVYRLPEQ